MEEEQTTQWPKEKVQRSTKHTLKTKDRVTRTPLKTGGEQIVSTVSSKLNVYHIKYLYVYVLTIKILIIWNMFLSLNNKEFGCELSWKKILLILG